MVLPSTLSCPVCGRVFSPTHGAQRYCSDACAVLASRDRARDRHQAAMAELDVAAPPLPPDEAARLAVSALDESQRAALAGMMMTEREWDREVRRWER